jgi:anaerobic magnesium-protoporphyrin IX monomethyl ester cyclase
MESTLETLRLLEEQKSLISRVSLFRFVPLPGTYVYSHPEQFSLHGTDQDPGWNDGWERYHIHHNDEHWWGSMKDFAEVNRSYALLNDFVNATWPPAHQSN